MGGGKPGGGCSSRSQLRCFWHRCARCRCHRPGTDTGGKELLEQVPGGGRRELKLVWEQDLTPTSPPRAPLLFSFYWRGSFAPELKAGGKVAGTAR